MTMRVTEADTDTPMMGQKAIGKFKNRYKQYAAAVSVCMGAFCAGTCLAWTSPALAQLSPQTTSHTNNHSLRVPSTIDTSFNSTTTFIPPLTTYNNATANSTGKLHLTREEGATIGGFLSIGALVAALPAGYVADKIGRRPTILLISPVFMFAALLIVFASNAATIIAGRFFAGAATGAICVCAPMYLAEIAQTEIRGVITSFFPLFLGGGILFTCIVGAIASTWQILTAILAGAPVLMGVLFYVYGAESPVFLIRHERLKDAEDALKKLRSEGHDFRGELDDLQAEQNASRAAAKVSLLKVIKTRRTRRALIAGIGVLTFQQLCGINAVVFYTESIFEAVASSMSPDLIGIVNGVVQVSASYLSTMIIEKAGRRFFLQLSASGMMVGLLGLGAFFHFRGLGYTLAGFSFMPVLCAVAYMGFFCVGYAPVPWMLMGELFSSEIKGLASGLAIVTNWTCAFLVTFCFPLIGAYLSFYILALLMALGIVFVYYFVPETRGRTLGEIQEILDS